MKNEQMTSTFTIRHATTSDLDAIKQLADANRESLGFVMRSALSFGMAKQWLIVAERQHQIIGFAHYRHRRDGQTTLYEICVQAEMRGQGVGKVLVQHLCAEAALLGKSCLVLKTPIDLPANGFYQHLGFVCQETLPGKKRALNVWVQSW